MITSSAKSAIMSSYGKLDNEPRKPALDEQARLASFFSFPYTSEIGASVLAEAGFHYEGHNDSVMCRRCGLRYSGWQKGDNPILLHKKIFPCCPFFQNGEPEMTCFKDNFKVGSELFAGACGQAADTVTEQQKSDVGPGKCEQNAIVTFKETERTQIPKAESTFESDPNVPDNAVYRQDTVQSMPRSDTPKHFPAGTEDSAISNVPTETRTEEQIGKNFSNTSHDSAASHSNTLTGQASTASLETVTPKYGQFSVLATRLNSYRNWPKHLKQRPEDLAKAGLFYEGTDDHVRCFHCAGGLREWDPEDDPFYEHARWFPFCQFMRLTKGDPYIMGVQSGTIKPPDIQPDYQLKSGQRNEPNMFDHPAVLSVMEMGYSTAILTRAITVYRKRYGVELSADKLLPIVWEIEENNMDILPGEDIVGNEQTNDNRSDGTNDVMEIETSESVLKVIDDLMEENRELREQKRCKVCLDEEASIVFLPCGHLVTCPMCASALRKCPVCRTYIRGTVKAIIS